MAKSLLAAAKKFNVSLEVIFQALEKLGFSDIEPKDHSAKIPDEIWLALKKYYSQEKDIIDQKNADQPFADRNKSSISDNKNSTNPPPNKNGAVVCLGMILSYNGIRGFISCQDFKTKILFSRSEIERSNIACVKRGDIVSFIPQPNRTRPGYFFATKIIFIRFDFPTFDSLRIKEYDPKELFIGVLTNWNCRYGHIRSPLLKEKDTFLYYTRLLSSTIKPGDIIVYLPVQSRDNRSTYFAFFALPIQSASKEDLFTILESHGSVPYLPLNEYLERNFPRDFLLFRIKKEALDAKFQNLLKLVQKYELDYGAMPSDFITALTEAAQMYLWEKNIFTFEDQAIIKKYFKLAPYDEKKRLLSLQPQNGTKKKLL
jgi:hypothetical protein